MYINNAYNNDNDSTHVKACGVFTHLVFKLRLLAAAMVAQFIMLFQLQPVQFKYCCSINEYHSRNNH